MMRLAARNSVDRSRTGAATAFSRPRLVEDNGAPAGAFYRIGFAPREASFPV